MTDQEINERIHAACGYVREWSAAKAEFRWYGPYGHNHRAPDDYANDLNAMQRAWLTLDSEGRRRFADRLCDMICDGTPDPAIESVIGASAQQRAEAFLRALGKWEGA